jgi:hypothetical protein
MRMKSRVRLVVLLVSLLCIIPSVEPGTPKTGQCIKFWEDVKPLFPEREKVVKKPGKKTRAKKEAEEKRPHLPILQQALKWPKTHTMRVVVEGVKNPFLAGTCPSQEDSPSKASSSSMTVAVSS